MHAAVSCFTTSAERRTLRVPCHTQPQLRAEATSQGHLQMDPRLKQSCWFPTYLSLSETMYRSYNHCLEPLPNVPEQEEAETKSDHPSHPTCWVASAPWFYFQDCGRTERSARRYIPGETLLLRGRRPHLIQCLLQIIGEAAEEYYARWRGGGTSSHLNNQFSRACFDGDIFSSNLFVLMHW